MSSDERQTREICLPALGDAVTHGTITRWLKEIGDHISPEEPLFEVATDKVDSEIPAPHSGVLDSILAKEGDTVPVGSVVAKTVVSVEQSSHRTAGLATATNTDPPRSSHPVPVPAEPVKTETLTRLRRTIARRMVESLHTAAQLTTAVEVDLSRVARLRDVHQVAFLQRYGRKLGYLPFFAKAAVDSLSEHRTLHASLNADATEVTYHDSCHLGIAVDSPQGLMVPVIRHADSMDVGQLAEAIAGAAHKVRSGGVRPDDLTGGTFTLTNTGSRGALFDTPILNLPQTGILGTGTVVDRLVPSRDSADNLQIEVHPMVYLSATYDHRVVDGADAARFLMSIKGRLETASMPPV